MKQKTFVAGIAKLTFQRLVSTPDAGFFKHV